MGKWAEYFSASFVAFFYSRPKIHNRFSFRAALEISHELESEWASVTNQRKKHARGHAYISLMYHGTVVVDDRAFVFLLNWSKQDMQGCCAPVHCTTTVRMQDSAHKHLPFLLSNLANDCFFSNTTNELTALFGPYPKFILIFFSHLFLLHCSTTSWSNFFSVSMLFSVSSLLILPHCFSNSFVFPRIIPFSFLILQQNGFAPLTSASES